MKPEIFVGVFAVIVVIGALALVAILPSSFSIYSASGLPQSITGITAFNQSGSQITFVSNNAELSNVKFRVDTTIGAGGDETITASFLQPTALQNITFKKDVKIRPIRVNETVTYSVRNENYELIKFTSGDVGAFSSCPAGTNYKIDKGFFQGYQCVSETRVATKGVLTEPTYLAWADVSVVINGVPITTQVGSSGSGIPTTSEFRSGGALLGTVQWISEAQDLVFPMPNDYLIVYNNVGATNWKFASKADFDRYNSNIGTVRATLTSLQRDGYQSGFTFGGLIGIPVPSCIGSDCASKLSSYISPFNNIVNTISSSNKSIDYPNATVSNVDTKFKVSVTNNLFKKPRLLYSLTANAVGAEVSVGQPKILSTNPVYPACLAFNIGSPTPKQLTLKVQNIGSGSGNFSARLLDCGTNYQASASQTGSLGSGAQSDLIVTINTTGGVGKSTCHIEVYDTSFSSAKDSAQFCVDAKQSTICNVNSYRVVSQSIYKCNSDGTKEFFVDTCPNGVIFEGDTPKCAVTASGSSCGNNICEIGETESSCAIDCEVMQTPNDDEDTCDFPNKKVVKSETIYDLELFFGFIKLGPHTSETTACEMDVGAIATIVIIIVGAATLLVLFAKKGRKK